MGVNNNCCCFSIHQQAQQDLQSVMPALQEAIEALDSLDKSDISEIRVYFSPPELVKHVMAAVCVLLRHKPDWTTSKHLLADPGFLKRLVTFDKNSVPDKVRFGMHLKESRDQVDSVVSFPAFHLCSTQFESHIRVEPYM